MATIDDYDFSKGNAGSSLTVNSEAGQVRVGGYICMKEQFPCKVTAVSTSKTGKHGHAKCNFTAVDIFTGKKYEDIIPSTHTALIPVVVSKNYSLVDITEEDYLSLMDEEGNIREDVKLPEWPDNFAREIKALFESGKPQQVTVHNAMGKDQVTAIKEEQEIKA